MDGVKAEIDEYREAIDDIDEKIVFLLNKRAKLATKIGHIKRKFNLPVYVPSREEFIFEHVKSINPGPLQDSALQRLFERIIDETRRLERESTAK